MWLITKSIKQKNLHQIITKEKDRPRILLLQKENQLQIIEVKILPEAKQNYKSRLQEKFSRHASTIQKLTDINLSQRLEVKLPAAINQAAAEKVILHQSAALNLKLVLDLKAAADQNLITDRKQIAVQKQAVQGQAAVPDHDHTHVQVQVQEAVQLGAAAAAVGVVEQEAVEVEAAAVRAEDKC